MTRSQLVDAPELQRASLAQRAEATVQEIVDEDDSAHLVEARVRFAQAGNPGQNTLLVEAYVQVTPSTGTLTAAEMGGRLEERIRQALQRRMPDITPLVDVTVLDGT